MKIRELKIITDKSRPLSKILSSQIQNSIIYLAYRQQCQLFSNMPNYLLPKSLFYAAIIHYDQSPMIRNNKRSMNLCTRLAKAMNKSDP